MAKFTLGAANGGPQREELRTAIRVARFSSPSFAQFSVTTHHYDNSRTGWNSQESVLTPANVNSTTFGFLKTVALDDQVDAQPLVIPNLEFKVSNVLSEHTVVYVATEGNTIYGIGANNGNVLLKVNFGPPVPFPLGCNNTPNTGINSTPAIDPVAGLMYVIVYTQTASGPAYYIHALDLTTLADKVPPRLITASHTLSNGTMITFNATVQRQRPGLLLSNGNVYAGFRELLRSGSEPVAGVVVGLADRNIEAVGIEPAFRYPKLIDELFFSFLVLDVWRRFGRGLCREHSVYNGQLRPFGSDL